MPERQSILALLLGTVGMSDWGRLLVITGTRYEGWGMDGDLGRKLYYLRRFLRQATHLIEKLLCDMWAVGYSDLKEATHILG